MTGLTLLGELTHVEPGPRLQDLRMLSGACVAQRQFCLGVIPEDSPLGGEVAAFVVTGDPYPGYHGEVAIAVEHKPGETDHIAIQARATRARHNASLLRRAIPMALEQSGVGTVVLESDATNIDPELLEQVGFHPQPNGEMRWAA